MYNEVIKQLLRQMRILPEKLIVMYLMSMYGLTENLAQQQVHSACRSRVGYKIGDSIAMSPYLSMDSSYKKMAKAFRLVIHFLPESKEFAKATSPWLLHFPKGSYLIQIAYIENGMEFVTSKMIADSPMPLSERTYIKRIAIVENRQNLDKIKAAGFVNFCMVDDEYNLKIVAKFKPEEAWVDVPEK